MLSYRHAFHAGNHADVLKHGTLVLILESLLKKDKPFTAFDTHAGAGAYRLDDERLAQTGEAARGVQRLLAADSVPAELERYVNLCRTYAAHGMYPGSPEIMRSLMRRTDKLFLSELHTTEIEVLKGTVQCRPLAAETDTAADSDRFPIPTVRHTSGFALLNAAVPPLVKRGLILTDPSYETDGDYTDAAALVQAHRKWNTGIMALWYPLLFHRRRELQQLKATITGGVRSAAAKLGESSVICAELCVAPEKEPEPGTPRLYGSGMLIINPPYQLEEQLNVVLPYLSNILSPEGNWRIGHLV